MLCKFFEESYIFLFFFLDQEELPKRSLRVRSKAKPESETEPRNTPIKSKVSFKCL